MENIIVIIQPVQDVKTALYRLAFKLQCRLSIVE